MVGTASITTTELVYLYFSTSSSDATRFSIILNDPSNAKYSGYGRTLDADGGAYITSNQTIIANKPFILIVVANGLQAMGYIYVNGLATSGSFQQQSYFSNTISNTTLFLGSQDSGNDVQGYIGACGCCNQPIDSNQAQQLSNFLYQEWGIPLL